MHGVGHVLRRVSTPVLDFRVPPYRAVAVPTRCKSPRLRLPRSLYAVSALSPRSSTFPRQPCVRHPQTAWPALCWKVRSRAVCLPACPPAHGFVKDVYCHMTPLPPFSKGLGFWRKAMKLIQQYSRHVVQKRASHASGEQGIHGVPNHRRETVPVSASRHKPPAYARLPAPPNPARLPQAVRGSLASSPTDFSADGVLF